MAKKTSGKQIPMKRDVNLAQEERRETNRMQAILALVCIAVVVGLFCKFGVIDRLNAVWAAEQAADDAQVMLAQLENETKNYNEVLEEYRSYTALAEGTDPMQCLDLIESHLMRPAKVQSFAVADGLITAQISGVTLRQVSEIYVDLMAQTDVVENVQVYTAATEETGNEQVNANLTISLVGTDSEEAQE